MTAARQSEIAALRAAILATRSVRIEFDQLWLLWTEAAPRLAGSPDQAAALDAAVRELYGDGTIELPVRAWDRSTVPIRPRFITAPSARRAQRARPWVTFPWRAQLGWAASLTTLSDELFADLKAVNDWLGAHDGPDTPVVPVRYRSAEIFGREKRLEQLVTTVLFGPNRLTFDLLACVRVPPPLPAAIVGAGQDLLVVENSDAYWVAVEALRKAGGHVIGAVAWGCGKSFPAQVPSLSIDVAGRGALRGTAWYWGDYDPAGAQIATAAARAAEAVDVKPAVGLWSVMADLPVQTAGTVDWSDAVGSDWFGQDLWDRLAHVRDSRGRIAQELVPVDVVAAWAAALT